jgi:ribosomally synthesized peptide (two-chain TOMM family)
MTLAITNLMESMMNISTMEGQSTYQKFLYFRATIIQAIAIAWADPEFKQSLLKNPKEALLERLGYKLPFDMHLAAVPDSALWNPSLNLGWISLQEDGLEMILPPKPADGQEAIALAAYNTQHLTFLNTSRS